MRGRFAKGMIVGSMIGASVGMMMKNGGFNKRGMMRSGRDIARSFSDMMRFIR